MFRLIALMIVAGSVCGLLAGCGSSSGPDSHTEVFQTADQARAKREAALLAQWNETAQAVLKADRPDLRAATTQPFGVRIEADGRELILDLLPLKTQLAARDSSPREILRKHFHNKLRPFDQDRLIALGFDRALARLEPYLLSGNEAGPLAEQCGDDRLAIITGVIGTMRWTPLARFTQEHAVPISARVVAAWKVPSANVNHAAIENLRPQLKPEAILSTPFAGLGNVGNLKSGTNPAIILLPDFLPTVRKQWQIDDALVLLAASRSDVRFVPRGNRKLLDMIGKFWLTALQRATEPLATTLLVRDDNGFEVYVAPATAPVKPPPATKPATRVYIVH